MLITACTDQGPVAFAPVGAPTPAEEAALAACAQQIAAGIAASLTDVGASCTCSCAEPPLVDTSFPSVADGCVQKRLTDLQTIVGGASSPDEPGIGAPVGAGSPSHDGLLAQPDDEVLCWWGQSVHDWQLLLPLGAAEDVLAGLLGHVTLAAGHLTSVTDEALLALQCQKIGEQVSQRLGLPRPAQHGVCLTASAALLAATPMVQFALHLRLHGRTHLARLKVPLDLLRPVLPAAPSHGLGIDPSVVAEAPVTVQAVLPGPTLTAGQLLGLEPGDVVCLGEAAREALLQVEGVTIGRGRAGAQAGRLAVNIRAMASPEIASSSEVRHHGS